MRNKSQRPKTFPKENEKKLKETIRKLRAELRHVLKLNKILREEVENILKSARQRKQNVEVRTSEEWRAQFVKSFYDSLRKREEEEKCSLDLNTSNSKKGK